MLNPGCRYMAVVKANAYGHGDTIVARAALDAGAEWLGVILPSEAQRLRDAGIDAPILLLHEPQPAHADAVVAMRVTPAVYSAGGVAALDVAAARAGVTLPVHLKIDTGMHRLGVQPHSLGEIVAALARCSHLDVEGVFSHFAIAESIADPSIAMQMERFDDACAMLDKQGITPALRHIGNSATALAHPEAHLDLVRVGISTYGIAPAPPMRSLPLRPAMTLAARVARAERVAAGEGVSYGLHYRLAKESTIATIPLGYADGWPRHTTGRTWVLIGGRRHPVVGTICMDAFMVDVGDVSCDAGDEAVLIGEQGSERITADEIADALGTIAYEIVTQISSRVERVPNG